MDSFFDSFLKGLFSALPAIIAAMGIVINNLRASARNKKDRSIKKKIDIVDEIYNEFIEITKKYIYLSASFSSEMFLAQEELIQYGVDTHSTKIKNEWFELSKKAIYLASSRQLFLKEFNIQIDADELAKTITKHSNKIDSYINVIVYVTKLYIVIFYDTGDLDSTDKLVIEELKKELEERNNSYDNELLDIVEDYCGSHKKEKIMQFDKAIEAFSDEEKRKISAGIKFVIRMMANELKDKDVLDSFDIFENQVIKEFKKLLL